MATTAGGLIAASLAAAARGAGGAKPVVSLFTSGGMSQLDTFDPIIANRLSTAPLPEPLALASGVELREALW
jgi:hypothetical protein